MRPCAYHLDRSKNVALALDTDVKPGRHRLGVLPSNRETVHLANLFADGTEPAGGWYLVKEQREWILDQLYAVMRGRHREPIRLLVAGIASFVHYYTFIWIVAKALARHFYETEVQICVVDRCVFPILQIRAIESLRRSRDLKTGSIFVAGQELHIRGDIIDLINPIQGVLDAIELNSFVEDLRQPDLNDRLGGFSLITEHFISAFNCTDELRMIRRNFRNLLDHDGLLLCATGMNDGRSDYDDYQKMMQIEGFSIVDKSVQLSWDPYGIRRERLLDLREDFTDMIPISFDNTLAAYSLTNTRKR